MKRLYCRRRRLSSLLIILLFLIAVTLKILEKTRPPPEPIVIISADYERTEFTNLSSDYVTISYLNNSTSPPNTSLVESNDNNYNFINNVTEQIPKEKDAKQFIFYQAIWNCLCSRRFMYPPSTQNRLGNFSKLNSSCSDEGTHYQPNQNVISMSLFILPRPPHKKDSFSSYQIGLVQNLIKMRQHYPNYSLRIYTNITLLANSSWCKFVCENDDLFWCDIRATPSHGDLSYMNFRTWRFLVLGDPTVQIFHSRDVDSLISYREAAAAQDWLEFVGYKAFQLMRDARYFHGVPILAGMWGAQNARLLKNGRGTLLREEIIRTSQLKKNRGTKHWDQNMLSRLIVDAHSKDVVAYDSYYCKIWAKKTMVRPFPAQRLADIPARDFVGNIMNFTGDGKGKIYTMNKADLECPLECRPSYGKDWVYC